MKPKNLARWLTAGHWNSYECIRDVYAEMDEHEEPTHHATYKVALEALEALAECREKISITVNLPNFAEHYGTLFHGVLTALIAGFPRQEVKE